MGKLAAHKLGTDAERDFAGGGGQSFIKYVGDESFVVRFITEPDEWVGYDEYFDDSSRRFVPMEEGEVLPEDEKSSRRYLCEAIIIEEDEVVPLKLPKSLAGDLYDTMKLTGSIIDRDFTLARTGKGLNTEYKNFPSAPSERNFDKYERINLMEVLQSARDDALGLTAGPFDDDDVDDDDGDEPEEKPVAKKAPAKKATKKAAEKSDSTIPSMEDMLAMDSDELREIAASNGVEVDEGARKGALIDALVDASEE